eukprot:10877429-Lingulodinium_polyedra.AAC.1
MAMFMAAVNGQGTQAEAAARARHLDAEVTCNVLSRFGPVSYTPNLSGWAAPPAKVVTNVPAQTKYKAAPSDRAEKSAKPLRPAVK